MTLKTNVLLLMLTLGINALSFSQSPFVKNPLLVHSNKPLAFDKVDKTTVREATKEVLAISDKRIKAIDVLSKKGASANEIILAFDELFYDLTDLSAKLGIVLNTYADDSARNVANDAVQQLGIYYSNLNLNEDLYNALSKINKQPDAKLLPTYKKKFLRETLLGFEQNGMKLPLTKRKELAAINEKLVTLSTTFDKNISDSKDSISYTEEDLKGVPNEYKKAWKKADGTYTVYIDEPNCNNILRYAESDATRHSIYLKYNNRAYPQNIAVFDSLLCYRDVFAKKLGFKSYASYAVVNKMAATTANVWNFEYDLAKKLTPQIPKDLKELSDLKHSKHPELSSVIEDWDFAYYGKELLDNKFQLKTDEVKEYFEMNHTIEGMFKVYEKLFDIQIKATPSVPLWSKKVKAYELFSEGKKVGSFYLDLFPRPNKYTWFACFPISAYRIKNGVEVLPISALICNFPEGNAQQPSLLNHRDVITLFHEFGHLVHSLLGRSVLASQGSFGVKADFVEAPSQFLENFCWEYEPLSIVAKHYKTGKPLPRNLFDKMKKSQLLGSANAAIRQVVFGTLDFTYEDKYDSIKSAPLNNVYMNLYSLKQVAFPDSNHFICSFGHLNGYGANYYGYLWSKVFAQDMFSVFEKNGVMDVKTGISYKKNILEKGSTIEETEMLKNFLGREPNSKAFLKSLGIKQ